MQRADQVALVDIGLHMQGGRGLRIAQRRIGFRSVGQLCDKRADKDIARTVVWT